MAKKWETQSLIRNMLLWAATTRTYFYVKYINTSENCLADPLSRLDFVRFWTNVSRSRLRMNDFPLDFEFWSWNDCDEF